MAQFEKGQPRPANSGRKKGSINKTTTKAKKAVANILEGFDAKAVFDELEAKEQMKIWLELMEYIQPKYARRDMELEERIAALEKTMDFENNLDERRQAI